MAFKDQMGEHGNGQQSFLDNLYVRIRWGLRGRTQPVPPPMAATGFAALALGHARPLPLRPTSCFAVPLPRAFPWRPRGMAAASSMGGEPPRRPSAEPLRSTAPAPKRQRLSDAGTGTEGDPDDKEATLAREAWADRVTSMGGGHRAFSSK